MTFRPTSRRAFTLIEIMIVVAIIAIVCSAGIPMMWKALGKNESAKAVHDILEGCKLARDRAILANRPYDFVIRNRENETVFDVEPARIQDPTGLAFPGSAKAQTNSEPGSLLGDFPRKLGERSRISEFLVNYENQMLREEGHVRFYPNGTCDEFAAAIRIENEGTDRIIKSDIVTGSVFEVTK